MWWLLEAQTDAALNAIIVSFLLGVMMPIAGPRIGQTTPAQWRSTQRASAKWRYASSAAGLTGGITGLVALFSLHAPIESRWVALAGCGLSMLLVIPAVLEAGRAMSATRRAEDAAHLHHTAKPLT